MGRTRSVSAPEARLTLCPVSPKTDPIPPQSEPPPSELYWSGWWSWRVQRAPPASACCLLLQPVGSDTWWYSFKLHNSVHAQFKSVFFKQNVQNVLWGHLSCWCLWQRRRRKECLTSQHTERDIINTCCNKGMWRISDSMKDEAFERQIGAVTPDQTQETSDSRSQPARSNGAHMV